MVTRISRLFIALMAMFALLVPSLAFAEETSSDGVFFNLTSDKQEYDVGDTATFSLQIANNSSEEISAVEYSLELPPGMEALNLLQLSQSVGNVASGETKSFEVKANVTGQYLDDENLSGGSTDGRQDSGELAKTGDSSGVIFILMGLAIVGAGVAIVAGIKGRHTVLSVCLRLDWRVRSLWLHLRMPLLMGSINLFRLNRIFLLLAKLVLLMRHFLIRLVRRMVLKSLEKFPVVNGSSNCLMLRKWI